MSLRQWQRAVAVVCTPSSFLTPPTKHTHTHTHTTYSCVPAALSLANEAKDGKDGKEADATDGWGGITALIEAAVARAEEARDGSVAAGREAALIAGCVPPLHESYRHDRVGYECVWYRHMCMCAFVCVLCVCLFVCVCLVVL